MTSNFLHHYLAVGLLAERPTNPVTDLDWITNSELIVFYLAMDTGELFFFNPQTEAWVQITTS